MPLQHFSLPPICKPISLNFCEVIFGSKILDDNYYKIKKKTIYFNITEDKIDIINFIQNIDKNNKLKIVELKHHNREGDVVSYIVIENFYFTKIINLLDFNNKKVDIMKIKVKFNFDKSTFFNPDNYKIYIKKLNRKLKLQQIELK